MTAAPVDIRGISNASTKAHPKARRASLIADLGSDKGRSLHAGRPLMFDA
jgi:hypothetical protein